MNKILVIGASGYVGSRLVPCLLQKGYRVRAAGRSLENLKQRTWASNPNVELFPVDILDKDSLHQACQGSTLAYYLAHSRNPYQKDFAAADREAAKNMVEAADQSSLSRIIYLGGLGDVHSELSLHERSRMEVSDILHAGTVSTTTLKAAMIIGTGSVPFEILRHLVNRMSVMIAPRWVHTPFQPISISNVLTYLLGCLEAQETVGEIFDIGGPDVMTYRQLMDIYSEEAHLPKRMVVSVPVLMPEVSSYWIRLVTPVSSVLATSVVEGLRNSVTCQDHRIRSILPQRLFSCREAIRLSLDVAPGSPGDPASPSGEAMRPELKYPGDPVWVGGETVKSA